MSTAKKSLGQHWLRDVPTLEYIVNLADIKPIDTVLEIGPGQGDLTRQLLKKTKKVITVEKDEKLAASLKKRLSEHISSISKEAPWRLTVVAGDILEFDLTG